jgi:hypothetical protein
VAINQADTLQRVYDNYCRILLMLTEVIAGQATQQTIDALTTAVEGQGIVRPKLTSSVDGESYDWTGYQQALLGPDGKSGMMAAIRQQIIFLQGPFFVNSRAR